MRPAAAFPDQPTRLGPYGERKEGERLDHVHLLLDVAAYYGGPEGTDAWSISPLIGARFRLSDHFAIDAQWGMAHASIKQENSNEQDNQFRLGNPYVGFHYIQTQGEFEYRLGAGAAAPLATLPDDLNERVTAQAAYTFAAGMRGNWDFWLWDPHAISGVLTGRLERQRSNGFYWGAESAVAVMVPISDKNEKIDPVVQVGGDMGYRILPWLRSGARTHLVVIPLLDGQKTQLAVEPYVRMGSDFAFFVVRLMINIDNPNGFSFDKNEVWGLRLGGGVAF